MNGFSLPELLIVIAVMAIVGTASYPIVNNLGEASNHAEAKAKAETLTAAKIVYKKSDPGAETAWEATDSDTARFQLLRDYLDGVSDQISLAEFAADPPYHQFNFGAGIRDRVTVIETES